MDNDNEFNFSSDNKFQKAIPVKKHSNFKSAFVSFISGIAGATLVVATCFGVPNIKNRLIGTSSNQIITTSNDSSSGYINLINLSEYSETAVSVASSVLPSVVGITVNYSINSVFGQSSATATGSGIILTSDGYIVTNNHVISSESSSSYYQITNANSIVVKLYNDSTEYKATIVGTDSYTDLAIIKIDATGLTPATLGNSDDLKVGEFVMAIGNPLGLDTTVTSGIVSALDREVEDEEGNIYTTIQTDAAINSGNSGGALVNSKGQVVGINSMKLSGTDIEGIGFAIPISSATNVINQLIDKGSVIRPYIGIAGSDISEATSSRYNIPQGVYVEEVQEDSPASKAGLQKGDIITAINGNNIKTISELNKVKFTCNVGDKVTLTLTRNNQEMNVELTLVEEPQKTEEANTQNSNIQTYEDILRNFQNR
ncbi:MAG: S1C family serine protease [Candidatus Scatovivens sp.]